MLTITGPQAQTILGPHLSSIRQVFHQAHRRYMDLPATARFPLGPTSQANMTHDYIVEAATREFSGLDGVRVLAPDQYSFFAIDFDGQILARFKKCDGNGHTSNYPTRQQKRIRSGKNLPGMPPELVLVDIGYELDLFGVEIRMIHVGLTSGRFLFAVAAAADQERDVVALPLVASSDQPEELFVMTAVDSDLDVENSGTEDSKGV